MTATARGTGFAPSEWRTAAPAFLLFLAPLLRGSWDLWAQTLIQIAAAAAVVLHVGTGGRVVGALGVQTASLVWLGASFLSFLTSGFPHSAGPGFLNDLTAVLFFFWAGSLAAEDGPRASRIPQAAAAASVAVGLAAFIGEQALVNPGPRAAFHVLTLPLLLRFGLAEGKAGAAWKTGLVVVWISLAMTKSVSAAVALAAVAALWLWPRRRSLTTGHRLLAAVAAGLALIAVVLSAAGTVRDALPAQRGHWLAAAARMTAAHPLLGAGPGAFGEAFPGFRGDHPAVQNTLYAHNFPAEMAAERGLGGLAAFLTVLFFVGRRAVDALRQRGDRSLEFAAGLGLAGFLIFNLANFGLSIPALSWTFWALAGFVSGFAAEPVAAPRTVRATLLAAGTAAVFLAAQSIRLFRADQFLARARSAAREGNWETVLALTGRSLRWNPRAPETHSWRAAALARTNDLEGALRDQRTAVELSPYTARFRIEHAGLLNAAGRREEAYSELGRAAELNPLDAAVWLKRGELAESLGRTGEARAAYARVIELNEGLYARLFPGAERHRGALAEARERLDRLEQTGHE